METSALPALRPLRLGELLDQAIRLYRRNFLTFVGIIALVYIPYELIQVVYILISTSSLQLMRDNPQSSAFLPTYFFSLLVLMAGAFVYAVFVTGIGSVSLTSAVVRNYLGKKTGIIESYQQLGSWWLKLLVTLLLFAAILTAASLWMWVPLAGWLTGFGLYVFLGGIVGELLPAVMVVEKLDGLAPISRAWNLARRRFWWVIGVAVVIYIFNLLIVVGPVLLFNTIIPILLGDHMPLFDATRLTSLVSVVAGGLVHLMVLPLQMIAWTLVYFDLRIRTEGFDLSLLSIDITGNPELDLSKLPAAHASEKWLTGDDIGKFIVVTLVGGGIFALLIAVFMVFVFISAGTLAGGL